MLRSTLVIFVMLAGIAVGAGTRLARESQASAAPDATPFPAQSAVTAPAATATPLYHFVFVPTPSPVTTPFAGPGAPEIHEIDLNSQMLVTPGEVHVRVLTNREVVTVFARALGREIGIPKQEAGVFVLDGSVGGAPSYFSGHTFDVDFVATVSDGRTATITLPLGLK